MEDGSHEVLYDEEESINFLIFRPNGEIVSARLKPKKVFERFVRSRHLSPDPFAYMCKSRPLVLDGSVGILIREYAIPEGEVNC
ncbi:MAG: hypothetical protein GXO39_09160 [Thermotogae bacterium]|nr:hypothetical protein [Thermotogota bacterium]